MLALRRCNLSKTTCLLTRLSSSSARAPPSPPSQSQTHGESSPQDTRASQTTHREAAAAAAAPAAAPRRSDASGSRGNDAMALPSPGQPHHAPPSSPSDASSQTTQTLRVGGDALRLDAMGPLVVNVDGSVGRVANWAEMTPGEREGTMRLLQRRNQERLRVLREKKDMEGK